jgi:hypothetical protein
MHVTSLLSLFPLQSNKLTGEEAWALKEHGNKLQARKLIKLFLPFHALATFFTEYKTQCHKTHMV